MRVRVTVRFRVRGLGLGLRLGLGLGLDKDKNNNRDENIGKNEHETKKGCAERGTRHEIQLFWKKNKSIQKNTTDKNPDKIGFC